MTTPRPDDTEREAQTSGAGTPPEGYAAALAELENILARLDRGDVDVDLLAAQVSRASQLISYCRERIGTARAQIERTLDGLPS